MNAYNAVKTGLYGVVFEDADVAEGAELVSEETGKRQVVLVFDGLRKNNAWKAGEGSPAVKTLNKPRRKTKRFCRTPQGAPPCCGSQTLVFIH